ncbi:exosporium glycoprotein BclB-related protein [Paenibacillus alvei]|uniref:exosporium glycoprotein BclB-related protein n=1 Tax=Paenibacillus alvei TaxID=44250 RepID=UPI00041DDF7E|nr:exosporium glycoprotein BclB-related protein [Paenibacillus alvei]
MLTTGFCGVAGIGGLIGFGNSAQTPSVLGPTIDLTGGPGIPLNLAFTVPCGGTIKCIAAYFSVTSGLCLDCLGGVNQTLTIHAQLWQSTVPDNIFTPIAGTLVDLQPSLTGVITLGEHVNGLLSGLNIVVPPQTRLLLVFSVTTTGLTEPISIAGYASGGVTIISN